MEWTLAPAPAHIPVPHRRAQCPACLAHAQSAAALRPSCQSPAQQAPPGMQQKGQFSGCWPCSNPGTPHVLRYDQKARLSHVVIAAAPSPAHDKSGCACCNLHNKHSTCTACNPCRSGSPRAACLLPSYRPELAPHPGTCPRRKDARRRRTRWACREHMYPQTPRRWPALCSSQPSVQQSHSVSRSCFRTSAVSGDERRMT